MKLEFIVTNHCVCRIDLYWETLFLTDHSRELLTLLVSITICIQLVEPATKPPSQYTIVKFPGWNLMEIPSLPLHPTFIFFSFVSRVTPARRNFNCSLPRFERALACVITCLPCWRGWWMICIKVVFPSWIMLPRNPVLEMGRVKRLETLRNTDVIQISENEGVRREYEGKTEWAT